MKNPGVFRMRRCIHVPRLLTVMMAILLTVGSATAVWATSQSGHTDAAAQHEVKAEAEGHGAASGSGHEANGHSGESHGGKGWVATDTYRVMNCLVLAVGLFLLLRKPVSQAFNSRIVNIRKQLDELELKKAEAEKKLASYAEKISSLEREAETIVAEYVKQGNEARDRILKEAETIAAKLEEQAKQNIEHEFQKAKASLKAEILEKALVKAESLLKANISDNDQKRLVHEYLEKVVA